MEPLCEYVGLDHVAAMQGIITATLLLYKSIVLVGNVPCCHLWQCRTCLTFNAFENAGLQKIMLKRFMKKKYMIELS